MIGTKIFSHMWNYKIITYFLFKNNAALLALKKKVYLLTHNNVIKNKLHGNFLCQR